MSGHQRVIATGRLGQAPTVKAPQAGGLIAEFSIAVDDVYTDRAGERHEHTEWLRIKAFGRAAEIAQQYLDKGRLVTIEGKLHTEKWQDQDGRDRYGTWIYLSPGGLTMHGGNEHEATRREHQGRTAPAPAGAAEPETETTGAVDDDYPF